MSLYCKCGNRTARYRRTIREHVCDACYEVSVRTREDIKIPVCTARKEICGYNYDYSITDGFYAYEYNVLLPEEVEYDS